MDTLQLAEGALVERYEVLGLLGEGGLARVYRVRHTQLGTIHALKLLTLRRTGLADRLLLEGRIQAQLRHPNVVAVSDVVQYEGQPGLIIEFVEGPTLDDWLRNEGPPPVETALNLFSQILAGVRAAHLVGVLHRDLKPANILLQVLANQQVVPKVADFGIAKVAMESAPGETPAGATRVGSAMGTPGYMAPEQFNDASGVDVRADIFALGTILYEILSGRPTFSGPTLLDTLNAVAKGQYLPLQDLTSGVPDHVVDAVAKAVSANPADRYPTCDAFAEAVFAGQLDLRDRVIQATPAGPVQLSRRPTGPERPAVAPPPRPKTPTPSPNRGTRASGTMLSGDRAPETMLPGGLGDDGPADTPRKPDRRPLVALAALVAATGGGLLLFLAVWFATRPGDPVADPGLPAVPVVTAPVVLPATTAPDVAMTPEAALSVAPAVGSPAVASPVGPAGSQSTPTTPAGPATSVAAAPVAATPAAEPTASAVATAPAATQVAALPAESASLAPGPASAPPSAPPEAAPIADIQGKWSGRWNGRPLTLRIESQSGQAVRARVEVLLGTTPRGWSASGTFDGARLSLTGDDGFQMTGTLSGGKFSGSITAMGQKAAAWDGSR